MTNRLFTKESALKPTARAKHPPGISLHFFTSFFSLPFSHEVASTIFTWIILTLDFFLLPFLACHGKSSHSIPSFDCYNYCEGSSSRSESHLYIVPRISALTLFTHNSSPAFEVAILTYTRELNFE